MANGNLPIGTTEDCLEDYFQRFPSDEAQKLMVKFTHANDQTVRDWHAGRYRPSGELLLRLRCFLDLVGYHVVEFDDHPKVTRQFARLIAYDIFSIEDARSALNYQNTTGVYTVLLRGQSLRADRVDRLQRSVQENLELLEEAAATWRPAIEQMLHPHLVQDAPLVGSLGEGEDARSAELPDAKSMQNVHLTSQVDVDVRHEAEVIDHLVSALSAMLDNGQQEGLPRLAPLPAKRRQPIYDRIGERRLRELIEKLDLLSLFG